MFHIAAWQLLLYRFDCNKSHSDFQITKLEMSLRARKLKW